MSVFEKHRFEIWNPTQHPYKHTLSDFAFANNSIPWVHDLEGALNAIFSVLYPNTKESVATPGDLPSSGNSPLDYRVVRDDGDGKAASYRWEKREGDADYKWYKIYDMDWGEDTILSNFLTKTQDTYVSKKGQNDIDSDGNELTGDKAGQYIYGGSSANTNLTLYANSGDGTGANTGFVQFGDNVRPLADNEFSLGTALKRFKDAVLSGELIVNTLHILSGSIYDETKNIDFSDTNLVTSAMITATNFVMNGHGIWKHISTPASNPSAGFCYIYFKTDGRLYRKDSSGNEELIGLKFTSSNDNRLVKSDGTDGKAIQESGITVSDTDEISGVTGLTVDNITIDGSEIKTNSTNSNLLLTPDGTGILVVPNNLKILGSTTNKVKVTDSNGIFSDTNVEINAADEVSGLTKLDIDSLTLDGHTITSGTDLILKVGTGKAVKSDTITPNNSTDNLGDTAAPFNALYLSNMLSDGTNNILISTLLSLSDILNSVVDGASLFYDSATGKWLPSIPDSEIDHGTITGLNDDDHTQYFKKDGRSGGQEAVGGTEDSDNITIRSTSSATKGNIIVDSGIIPETDNTVSIGNSSKTIKDVYSSGIFNGLRFEADILSNFPAPSSSNIGRSIFATDKKKLYVSDGVSWTSSGSNKFAMDISFNGTETTKDVNVSSAIVDARTCIIQLLDNANNFDRIYCTLKAINSSTIRIDTDGIPLDAGSYRLVVKE